MRRVVLTALLFAITSASPPAAAQEAAGAQQAAWVEPSGRYTLGFPSLGWTGVPSAAHAPNIMAFVRNDSPRDDRMRICFVRHDAVPYSEGSSQVTANQILDRWDEARLSQVVGSPVATMAHARIAEVSAIDYRLQQQDLDTMARFFMIPSGAGMDLITISCAFPAPFTDEEVASINAAFDSIRILPQESQ